MFFPPYYLRTQIQASCCVTDMGCWTWLTQRSRHGNMITFDCVLHAEDLYIVKDHKSNYYVNYLLLFDKKC